MKNLWNPWREGHVLGLTKKSKYCIFEPPATGHYSKKDLLLYRDNHSVILLNRFPYANGHLLVAPKRHIADITQLDREENTTIMELLQASSNIIRKNMKCNGFNIGCNLGEVAGAGIASHLHFHIVPRWEGDHNFMTTISDIRTIPIHIERTFDMLLADFKELYATRHPRKDK